MEIQNINEDSFEYDEEENQEEKELLEFLQKEQIELNDKLNLIDPKSVQYFYESAYYFSRNIYHEFKATMYYNFIIVRKLKHTNSQFIKGFFNCLAKLMHPNIQLFYGLMLEKEDVINYNPASITRSFTLVNQKSSLFDDSLKTESNITSELSSKHPLDKYLLKDSNTLRKQPSNYVDKIKNDIVYNTSNHNKSITLSVILQLCNGIEISKISEVNRTLNEQERLRSSLIMIKLITQTLIFIHNSNTPYLNLNGKNIVVDFELFLRESTRKRLFKMDSYLEANLLKLTEIGMHYSFIKFLGFSIDTIDIYEASYMHPELLEKAYQEIKEENFNEFINHYEIYDKWSLACLMIEVFSEKQPLYFLYSISDLREIYNNKYLNVVKAYKKNDERFSNRSFTKFNNDNDTESKTNNNNADSSRFLNVDDNNDIEEIKFNCFCDIHACSLDEIKERLEPVMLFDKFINLLKHCIKDNLTLESLLNELNEILLFFISEKKKADIEAKLLTQEFKYDNLEDTKDPKNTKEFKEKKNNTKMNIENKDEIMLKNYIQKYAIYLEYELKKFKLLSEISKLIEQSDLLTLELNRSRITHESLEYEIKNSKNKSNVTTNHGILECVNSSSRVNSVIDMFFCKNYNLVYSNALLSTENFDLISNNTHGKEDSLTFMLNNQKKNIDDDGKSKVSLFDFRRTTFNFNEYNSIDNTDKGVDISNSNVKAKNNDRIDICVPYFEKIHDILYFSAVTDGTCVYYSITKNLLIVSGGKICFRKVKIKENEYKDTNETNINELESGDKNHQLPIFSDNKLILKAKSHDVAGIFINNVNDNKTNIIDIDNKDNYGCNFNEMNKDNKELVENKSSLLLNSSVKISNIILSKNHSTNPENFSFKNPSFKTISLSAGYTWKIILKEQKKNKKTNKDTNKKNKHTENETNDNDNADKRKSKTLQLRKNNFTILSDKNQSEYITENTLDKIKHYSLDKENYSDTIVPSLFSINKNTIIKRSNHTLFETEKNIIIIGGDQDKSCEIYDFNNNKFVLIKELNAIHVNPVVYSFEHSLYSINFTQIIKHLSKSYVKNKDKIRSKGVTYDYCTRSK